MGNKAYSFLGALGNSVPHVKAAPISDTSGSEMMASGVSSQESPLCPKGLYGE